MERERRRDGESDLMEGKNGGERSEKCVSHERLEGEENQTLRKLRINE